MQIRPLDEADLGYASFSWRESYKKAPGIDRMPWSFFKASVAPVLDGVLRDPSTVVIGAYAGDTLVGWLAMTPGKRVHTLHWCYVKHKLEDGTRVRRQGVMTALLKAANLGPRFIYTLHARRDKCSLPDGTVTKSLDETLVHVLRAEGVTATYVPLKEWLK